MAKKNKFIFISSTLGGMFSFLLGLMGLSGFCCTVLGATVLFYLGLAPLALFIAYNYWWLLLLSLFLITISVIYYLIRDKKKVCLKKKKLK